MRISRNSLESRSLARNRSRALVLEKLETKRLLAAPGENVATIAETAPMGHDAQHHHAVQITQTAIITPHDTIPRFAADPTTVAVNDGRWSDPSVWSTGVVPEADEIVSIPTGLEIVYDVNASVALDAVEIGGSLQFDPSIDTSLWLNELVVLPGGTFEVGTVSNPIEQSVTAEIVFTDSPQEDGHHFKTGTIGSPGIDPSQYGNGLLSFGTTVMHGSPIDQTFIELESIAKAGEDSIVVRVAPHGWREGDTIVFPDTRQINPVDNEGFYDYDGQFETARIARIEDRTIYLESPIQFSHFGPTDADGSPTLGLDGQIIMPHVGNLTRNVVIRSENPDGVRGHTMFFADSIRDIRYTTMEELGRTASGEIDNTVFDSNGQVTKIGSNQAGRYSDHLHHLRGPSDGIALHENGPSYQWISLGNSVTGALKWGTGIHSAHHGYLGKSVYYDSDGSAIATEDGSEYENMIEENFIVRVNGGGGRFSWHGVHRTSEDLGDMGDGIWLAGPMNTIRNNVVANATRNAYIVYTDNVPSVNRSTFRPVQVPRFPGANPHENGTTREVNLIAEPFDDFHGNEAYGATTAAVWLWSVGDRTHFPNTPGRNTLTDTTVWHVSGSGVYFYYANDHIIDGWLQRGDPDAIGLRITQGGSSKPGTAMTHGGATAATTEIRNADIQGVEVGFRNRGRGIADEITIRDSYFDNARNFVSETWAQNPIDGSRDMLISNVSFGDELNPGANVNLWMELRPTLDDAILVPETTTISDFRGWSGIDLDVYYEEQAPGFVIPETVGGPAAGLTNETAFATYGIAVGGRVAPTREIDGDDGEAALIRGRALGIEGLVFEDPAVQSHATRLSANVMVESGAPVLYFTVLGDDSHVDAVRWTIDGNVFHTSENPSGKVLLEGLPSVGSVELLGVPISSSGTTVQPLSLSLQTPIRPAPVGESNARPVIVAPTKQRITANEVLNFSVTASDEDQEPVEITVSKLPEGSRFVSASGEFTWQPSNFDAGEHRVDFTATDARGKKVTQSVEISVVYDSSQAPVLARWALDDPLIVVQDLSTNGNDGIASNTSPHPDGGMLFDGTSDVQIPSSASLRPEERIAINLWASPNGRTDTRDLIRFDSGSAAAFAVAVKDGGSASLQGYYATITTEMGTTKLLASKTAWQPGEWDHVFVTFDSGDSNGRLTIFVNGEIKATTEGVGERIVYKPFGSQSIRIGFGDNQGTGYQGGLSDIEISATETDPFDVFNRFNAGRDSSIQVANSQLFRLHTSTSIDSNMQDVKVAEPSVPDSVSSIHRITEWSPNAAVPTDDKLYDQENVENEQVSVSELVILAKKGWRHLQFVSQRIVSLVRSW